MTIPISEIMTGSVTNIINTYERATEEQQCGGENWYWMARHLAESLADQHNLPVTNVAYAIAALSPVTDWITNQIAASEVCATGFTRFQSGANIDKANRCLAGELTKLRGPKVERFALAIVNPLGDTTACIDRHAFSIWMGSKQTDIQQKVLARKGAYELVADAYAEAARILDVPVHTVQATTWIVWRDEHDVPRKIGK
tara:strand:+ start:282 stop:878 length:597 start_codon:yes stop_codon:yes gene_type:complete